MKIRAEKKEDIQAIFDLTRQAFKNCPYSRQTEPFIINALRDANALTLSLVCEKEGAVAGHIAFSPATLSDHSQGWYILGPISVLPRLQKQGIGKALVQEGLRLLRSLNAEGCILVGDSNYYQRFGFKSFPELTYEGVPQANVLALPFGEKLARGRITHHPAFAAES